MFHIICTVILILGGIRLVEAVLNIDRAVNEEREKQRQEQNKRRFG